jgi:hypothetical protein
MGQAEEIEYITKPQGITLQEYSDCRASRSFIMGPLGSGKTIQTINKVFDLMCEQEPVKDKEHKHYNKRLSRWGAVRNTYSELTSTTIKDWLECHEEFGTYREGSKEPPNQKLNFKLEDGTTVVAEIYFIAFDRPDHVKKARGLQLTGVWLNEIKELSKTVVNMLDLRIGRYPSRKEGAVPTWYGMIGDTNAPDEDHWYYLLSEEQKPNGWKFHRQPGGVIKVGNEWRENPNAENLNNLPDNYYLRGMEGKEDDWIKVNLGNEYGFVAEGKPVHPRYIDSIHCLDIEFKPDNNVEIILGFDFGRTPACAFIQKAEMNRWICFDEFTSEDMSAITFAPELKNYIDTEYPEFSYGFRGWGDPSGGKGGEATDDTAHKIIRAAGLPCSATQSNKAALRRAALEKPMTEMCMDGKPRFVILPKCKKIRKGLNGGFCYRRIQVSNERYTEEPDKNEWSHPVEALEYALQGEGEGRSAVTVKSNQKPARKPRPIRPMGRR